jgi:hypothetical protein
MRPGTTASRERTIIMERELNLTQQISLKQNQSHVFVQSLSTQITINFSEVDVKSWLGNCEDHPTIRSSQPRSTLGSQHVIWADGRCNAVYDTPTSGPQ